MAFSWWIHQKSKIESAKGNQGRFAPSASPTRAVTFMFCVTSTDRLAASVALGFESASSVPEIESEKLWV